jgi:ubiquinone/menaquinone biosynthesis C-methylase UbiE
VSNSNEKNRKAYDKKADNYDNTADGKFTEKFKKLLSENISMEDNDSILDVGCGNGTLLSKLSQIKKINGFGVDISPQMIKNASLRYPEFNFAVSDCENIPFNDHSMDMMTVCAAYHHFPDVDAFALEAKRIIKPNGNLYIAEVCLPVIIRQIANVFLPFSKDGDVKFYSTKEIENTFSNAGFRFVKVVKKGHIQIVQLQKNE